MKEWEKALMLHLRKHRDAHPRTWAPCNEILVALRPRHADIIDFVNFLHKHQYADGVTSISMLKEHDEKENGIFYNDSGVDQEIRLRLTPDGDRWLTDELIKEKTWRFGTIERIGLAIAIILSLASLIISWRQLEVALQEQAERRPLEKETPRIVSTPIEGSIQQRTAPAPLATPQAACDTIAH